MLDYIPVLEIALIFLAFMLKYNDYIAEKKKLDQKWFPCSWRIRID